MESPLCPPVESDFRLIETFGYRPGQGVVRRDLHLARMAASAAAFDIAFDRARAVQLISDLGADDPLRCRMTLAADGTLETTTAPMPLESGLWQFAIASDRLDSGDPMLAHKTTRRAIYDRARADLLVGIDEMIFLNERDEVCEGTITNISITTSEGRRLTPPLRSGCLPGVYRQSCLDAGLLEEAVLTLEDLAQADSINLVNSLRGSTSAIWAEDCARFGEYHTPQG